MRVRAVLGGCSEWWEAAVAGLATIGAYGVVLYSVGVLAVPIGAERGWGAGVPSGAVAAGVLLSGPSAIVAGSLLDRLGSRPVLLGALALGAPLLALSSVASEATLFVAAWAAGAAVVAGGLYYPVTMATMSRVYSAERRASAFAVLTFLGALASPIFYPLTGVLVSALGWRVAVRVLVLVMVVLVLPAALTLRTAPAPPRRAGVDLGVLEAVRSPSVWRLFVALGLAAAATSALLLHQVGALQGAGLTLGVASSIAGLRGFLQIPGRLVLAPLVRVLGLRGALGGAYVLCALGAGLLLLAPLGGVVFALAFAVAAGLSIGLLSPLQGLLAPEVYGAVRLGALSGVQQMVVATSGGAGAWVSGLALASSGGYEAPLAGVSVALLLAAVAMRWSARARVAVGAPSEEATV